VRLKGKWQWHEKKHATENAEAYQFYVRGRFYLAQRTRESIHKALDQLNQAVAKIKLRTGLFPGWHMRTSFS